MKYKLPEIHFSDEMSNNFLKRYSVSTESILYRVPGQEKEYHMKPRPIDNNYLEGDFEGELREGLQLYQDFVVVPEAIWLRLK
jgi:hypothetical protein